ncbi:MAG: hypothetical protein MUF64_15935 [Polyangiaceae bacterium]|nr:hypothetical protein [Polyangiaceae bacterium]
MKPLSRLSCIALLLVAGGASQLACSPAESPDAEVPVTGDEDEVIVRTETEEEWAQYQASLKFALGYKARCPATSGRPRVIVSGYGRFMSNRSNATGKMIQKLIPEALYPETDPPAPGEVDDPAPQTSVALGTLDLPGAGKVDVCAMILPVFWDLASILVLKEIQAFRPDLVLMNGIAGPAQPLWLELGSVNKAMNAPDGSNLLAPVEGSPLIPKASAADQARGLRMSWDAVKLAAEGAIAVESDTQDEQGNALQDILSGAKFAGFPRPSNTYLCNNVAYTVNYLMGYPGRSVKLMQASQPRPGQPSSISVKLTRDHRLTPRDFIHWPGSLSDRNLDAAARVLAAIIDAQLLALREGDLPTPGTNDRAEVTESSDTF